MRRIAIAGLLATAMPSAYASVVISEWMYSGSDGEFVEFTNVGASAVDMTNWSYSDSDATPFDLPFAAAFGVVQPGESVILTEADAATFRSAWRLSSSVKIVGPNSNSNLGRNDQINLYDAVGNLVDRLSFGDQTFPGTPRTQNRSCSIPVSDYGFTSAQSTWMLSGDGDEFGSWVSNGFDVGSPGSVVPEPTSLLALVAGGLTLLHRRRIGGRTRHTPRATRSH